MVGPSRLRFGSEGAKTSKFGATKAKSSGCSVALEVSLSKQSLARGHQGSRATFSVGTDDLTGGLRYRPGQREKIISYIERLCHVVSRSGDRPGGQLKPRTTGKIPRLGMVVAGAALAVVSCVNRSLQEEAIGPDLSSYVAGSGHESVRDIA